jgi:hypothetical protein
MQPALPRGFMKTNRASSTPKNKPKQSQSPNAIRDTQHEIRKSNPNEPDVKIGKMKISTEIVRVYANQQRTMNNECYPKQTQSNPIPTAHNPFFRSKTHIAR